MYRILGVFPDSNGDQHVKLIKYKQLGKRIWHSGSSSSWGKCTLNIELNGDYLLENTTYDYFQTKNWLNKIENWTWNSVSTLTSMTGIDGPNYINDLSPKDIYLHEMNRSTKVSSVGYWTTSMHKIGLMYVSDYLLSLGNEALALNDGTLTNANLLSTAWINLQNNDISKDSEYEWTISNSGMSAQTFGAWCISRIGNVRVIGAGSTAGLRPTFYLNSSVILNAGMGQLENPYILEIGDSSTSNLKVTLTRDSNILKGTITKGSANLTKYCINNSVSINDCTWKSISGTSLTYTMPDYGIYYVHVIDDQGFIAHSSLKYELPKLSEYLISNANLWQSGLEGDGYRYVGSGAVGESTNPNNFICFGTTSKSDCTANQDKYMYRILGVFPDSNGDQHIKLIKYKQLGTYAWNEDFQTETSWENSDMYKGLNGSYFLTNTTYDYLQNNIWLSKIENWTWSAVNTKTYEDQTKNTYYNYSSPKGIYLNEMHRTTTEALCKTYGNSAVNCNGGSWTTPTGKIGLMYASDYALSLGNEAIYLESVGQNEYGALLISGWMHQSNNDISKNENEWTISRNGAINNYFSAIYVNNAGNIYNQYVYITNSVRPVLYLKTDEKLNSGTGSLDNPFIIQ